MRYLMLVAAVAASLALCASASASSGARSLGAQLAAERGWTGSEWQALDTLWGVRESGWDPCKVYGGRHDCSYVGTKACGVPQSVPCRWPGRLGKTLSAQIQWGLAYIKARYGRPSAALAHSTAYGWY